MSALATQVLHDRVLRDTARAELDAHLAALKADIDERGIGGRIAEEMAEQARAIFDEAVTVAEEHPGAIGGTFAALVLWILRNPIIAWVEETLGFSSR